MGNACMMLALLVCAHNKCHVVFLKPRDVIFGGKGAIPLRRCIVRVVGAGKRHKFARDDPI